MAVKEILVNAADWVSVDRFHLGSLACLKSGGPVMTVDDPKLRADGTVTCLWFDGARLCREVFPPEMLEERNQIVA